jgi:hypothetical protein
MGPPTADLDSDRYGVPKRVSAGQLNTYARRIPQFWPQLVDFYTFEYVKARKTGNRVSTDTSAAQYVK